MLWLVRITLLTLPEPQINIENYWKVIVVFHERWAYGHGGSSTSLTWLDVSDSQCG